jgi:hypothetical protein
MLEEGKFGLCAWLKRMSTEMCFCTWVYMKSVHPTYHNYHNFSSYSLEQRKIKGYCGTSVFPFAKCMVSKRRGSPQLWKSYSFVTRLFFCCENKIFKMLFIFQVSARIHRFIPSSLGPVYEFVCVSFRTGNLNCFRVKWPWRSTWHMCQNLNPGRKSWKWPRPETAVST